MVDKSSKSDQSDIFSARMVRMPVGVVMKKSPGVTRWATDIWTPVALVPGANFPEWTELRRVGEVVEYHARSVEIELHRSEVEAYKVSLTMSPPSAFVVLDEDESESAVGWVVKEVTLSAYAAQDELDSGFGLVEPVPLPPVIIGWAQEFINYHYIEEPFKKRKRDRLDIDQVDDGIGDARVEQAADVYRTPGSLKKRKKH